MADITYDEHATCTNVVVTPASDAELITIILGFHPSSMVGVKIKDANEVAMLFWNTLLPTFCMLVGSDFADGYQNIIVSSCTNLYGPDPLTGDGVSKERLALGFQVFAGLVTETDAMHLTFYR